VEPTNITPEMREHFAALTNGPRDDYGLYSCYVNGVPSAAICKVERAGRKGFYITPLFVAVTATMVLTNHDGQVAE
jgi:hypothetical protein